MDIKKFQKTILDWYRKNRRDLPWRNTRDPYKILVSEIMLQQTQVTRVIPKYEEFLKAFPTLQALAQAPDKELMAVWAGLGYWRRAKYLKETTRILGKRARAVDLRSGVKRDEKTQLERFFPRTPEHLEKLPGIGPYTARALACFAFGNNEAFLDTNIRRVYLHFFFPKSKNVSDKKILGIAQKAVWLKNPREWHYALFDYGAIILKNKKINRQSRHYHKQSKFEGSFRSFRTKAVRFILKNPRNKIRKETLRQFLKKEIVDLKGQQLYTPKQIIDALLKDSLIKRSKTHYFL